MKNKIFANTSWFVFFIISIFILGFLVRLYRFNNPVADWHSWRQADTSAVSRIFAEKGFDILHPKYLDISNIQTGHDNPEGLRFVEFPLYNIFQAGLYKFFGILTIEEWGRLVTISSSLLAGLFLFLISKKYFGKTTASFSLIFYLFIPFSIYYGRTILPDTSMAMSILGGIYFFDRWLEKSSQFTVFSFQFLFALIFTACSFLLKPYALFFTLPFFVIAYNKFKFSFLKKWQLWIFLIISLIPLVLWRVWISQFPQGIPASAWLFNGNGIRFRPAFFRWILYERIIRLISGFFGIIFGLLGLWSLKKDKNRIFALSFLLSSILYVIVMATGNVQHDYYQILIIPSVALFMGLGGAYLWKKDFKFKILTLIIMILTFGIAWNIVQPYFNIDNPALVIAGKKADQILPKSAKVIAPYNGDTTLLYYINRPGWPAFEADLPDLEKLGANYMVIVSPTKNDLNGFGKEFKVLAKSKDYLILKLN